MEDSHVLWESYHFLDIMRTENGEEDVGAIAFWELYICVQDIKQNMYDSSK